VERVANKTRARVSNKHILLLKLTSQKQRVLRELFLSKKLSGYNLEKEI
jgi:hypothetical protein